MTCFKEITRSSYLLTTLWMISRRGWLIWWVFEESKSQTQEVSESCTFDEAALSKEPNGCLTLTFSLIQTLQLLSGSRSNCWVSRDNYNLIAVAQWYLREMFNYNVDCFTNKVLLLLLGDKFKLISCPKLLEYLLMLLPLVPIKFNNLKNYTAT